MSEPTTGSKITRVIYRGISDHLADNTYHAIKYRLNADQGTLMEPSVVYELSPSQIIRPFHENAKYLIHVDEEGIVSTCECRRYDSVSTYNLPPNSSDFKGLDVSRELVDYSSLLIKQNASFCNVILYISRVSYTKKIGNDNWTFIFSDGYKCPSYQGVLDKTKVENLYFTEPMIHQIEVQIEGWDIDVADILKTLNSNMPLCYHVTVPGTIIKNEPMGENSQEIRSNQVSSTLKS